MMSESVWCAGERLDQAGKQVLAGGPEPEAPRQEGESSSVKICRTKPSLVTSL